MTGEEEWQAMMDWLKKQKGEWAKMARHHLVISRDRLERMQEAEHENHALTKIVEEQNEILLAISAVTDVVDKASRGIVNAQKVLDVVLLDTAPFRNLMSTVYGLDALGCEPVKKRKSKT